MEIVGKVIEITPMESGVSEKGEWQRQQLVITTFDQNPIHIAFTAMGQRLNEISKCTIDQVVRVRFGVSSRKINNKWFSEIQLWEIKAV